MKKAKKSDLKRSEKLFYFSIVMLVSAFILLGLALSVNKNDQTRAVTVQTQRPFQVDEYFTTGDVGIKVTDVKTSDGTQPFVAPEGSEFLVVNLSIENRSDKPINVYPSTDTYIKTSDGEVSFMSLYALENPFRAGELLPGETIKGQTSYLVPKDKDNKLYIDAIWSGSVITVNVK